MTAALIGSSVHKRRKRRDETSKAAAAHLDTVLLNSRGSQVSLTCFLSEGDSEESGDDS